MTDSSKDGQLIKQILTSAKIIAMVGVSLAKKEESSNNIKLAALFTSFGTFILSCLIWFFFDY